MMQLNTLRNAAKSRGIASSWVLNSRCLSKTAKSRGSVDDFKKLVLRLKAKTWTKNDCSKVKIEFDKLIKSGQRPSHQTLHTVLKLFFKFRKVVDVRKILECMAEEAKKPTNFRHYAQFIEIANQSNKIIQAHHLVDNIAQKVSFKELSTLCTYIIQSHIQNEQHTLATQMVEKVKRFENPDTNTYNLILASYLKLCDFDQMHAILSEMKDKGVSPNLVTFNNLISMYGKQADAEKALSTFQDMHAEGINPNDRTFNKLIDCLCKAGKYNGAQTYVLEMKMKGISPDVVTYNTLINALLKEAKLEQAIDLISEMERTGLQPTYVTKTIMIGGYLRSGKIETGFEILNQMRKEGLYPNPNTPFTVVQALFDAAEPERAFAFFQNTKAKGEASIALYNDVIRGLSSAGKFDLGLAVRDDMEKAGMVPNLNTFRFFAEGYLAKKMVSEALYVLSEMAAYGIKPDLSMYKFMIKECISMQDFKSALSLIEDMKGEEIVPDTELLDLAISAYAALGENEKSHLFVRDMMDKGLKIDLSSVNKMLDGYMKSNKVPEAIAVAKNFQKDSEQAENILKAA